MHSMRRVKANEKVKEMSGERYADEIASNKRCKRTYQSKETERICKIVDETYRKKTQSKKCSTHKWG